ncbi:nucleotide exchange factor GrpE [Rubrobacter aplysinae]|uniref:nucleotide exchange factor GrpE n=1 Tax=Rubrobacter aplysinae TaxID=909625 RepID=UPI00064B8999|nr:nucleotide exchange factor GrpE [Rubrobacter aplysinae]
MSSEENNRDNQEHPEETPREESVQEGEDAPGSGPDPEEAVEGEVVFEEAADTGEPEEPEMAEAGQVAALTEELEALRAERDETLDSLKRLRAEFENSRKRQERERERILETASEKLVKELLPVVDNLDRALQAEGDIRGGVSSTRDQLVSILGEEGLSPVSSDGEHFDPNVHEAVMGQPSEEHEDGTVIQTFERGYVLNGKSIRPAKVVVARQG